MPSYVFKNSNKDVGPWVTTLENDREAELMAAGWAADGWSLVNDDDEAADLVEKSQAAPAEPVKASPKPAAKKSTPTEEN